MTRRFGSFVLDPVRRQLICGDDVVHLTPKAWDLLALLVSEAPRVVPKSELHARLWPGTFVTDATLVSVVKEIRRALADDNRDAPLIRTVHRVGYAFCAPLDSAQEPSRAIVHWIIVAQRRIALQDGENLIGRDVGSTVWLDSGSVSRRHAQVVVEHGAALLEDLGSKNGTRLGARPVTARVRLQDGDQIQIGALTLVYRAQFSGFPTETQVQSPL